MVCFEADAIADADVIQIIRSTKIGNKLSSRIHANHEHNAREPSSLAGPSDLDVKRVFMCKTGSYSDA